MAKVTRALIEEIAAFTGKFCISIYIPTHRYGEEVQKGKDALVLKNALSQVVDRLAEAGMRSQEIESYTTPIRGLIQNPVFWSNQKEGLAVFLGENYFETVQLNTTVPKIQWISDHFYLRPLITHYKPKWEFYVLALDLQNIALYHATNSEIENINAHHPDLPTQIEDVVSVDDREAGLQFRTQHGPLGNASYHGHGGGKEVKKKEIQQFFRAINNQLIGFLRSEKKPLVIISQEYLYPIYKEINEYNKLLDKFVPLHPAGKREMDIHNKAWELINPQYLEDRDLKIKNFKQLHGTGKTSTNIRKIVQIARQGRVDTLFIAENKDILGYYNKDTDEVIVEEMPETRKTSLVNDAAIHTFLANGDVYQLNQSEMPDDHKPVNVVMRS